MKKWGIIMGIFCGCIVLFARPTHACLTTTQVAQDATHCYYIMNGNVYEKGSKSKPHHGHPCGMDVSSIIPSFHFDNISKYLDPNRRDTLCTTTVPTATPIPPTLTRQPTASPIPTNSPSPSITPSLTPTPTATLTPTLTPTPTLIPTVVVPTISPDPVQCPQFSHGDADCDEVVNLIDYVCYMEVYHGELIPASSNCTTPDFDRDGFLSTADLQIWANTFLGL